MQTFQIDDQTYAQLERQAISRGLTVQSWIRAVADSSEEAGNGQLKDSTPRLGALDAFLARIEARDMPSNGGAWTGHAKAFTTDRPPGWTFSLIPASWEDWQIQAIHFEDK